MRSRALVAFAFLLGASSAAAQPSDDLARAKKLFDQAKKDEEAGHWQPCIDGLDQVLAVKRAAGVLFHRANCEEHAGRIGSALRDFREAGRLAEEQHADDVTVLVPDRVKALDGRAPRLAIRTPSPPPDGLHVDVDGASVALAELGSYPVDPGEHLVTGTATGKDPVSMKVRAVELGTTPVPLQFGAAPGATTAPPPPPSATTTPDAPRSPGVPTVTWIAAGAAVAFAAGGFIAFAVAGGKNAGARDACTASSCDREARDGVRTLDRVALGLWIGAAASAGVAVATFALRPRSAEPARASLVVGPRGAVLAGTF